MKRKFIMFLSILSVFTLVACSSVNNENNVGENKEDIIVNEALNEEESLFKEKYNMVEQMLENKKMSILRAKDNEIEAENGIGERIIYKLNEDDKIVINFSTSLTNILDDGNYDIDGTVLSNILNEILNDDKYIKDINEAIKKFFNEEREIYTVDVDKLRIEINKSYDIININITI